MYTLSRLQARIMDTLWGIDLSLLSPVRTRVVRLLRGVYALARDLADGQLSLRAMSLVYTTLLSLVPLLAVSFSVLKAFGVHNKIQPVLLQFLEPLGTKGVEITVQILVFVENIKVGVLGALGLGMLIYTVISLLQKVEQAFNYTWNIQQPRPLVQRFSQYLSVLTVGPVLVFSALGLTATLMSQSLAQQIIGAAPLGGIISVITRLVPYVLIITAFTFAYVFVPNTKVRFTSALVGGVIAGVLWQLSGWAFATFVVSSARYTAIYSGFAIIIVFMIWLYLSWLILLIGASIAYYHQHPEHLTLHRGPLLLSNRVKERLALLAMAAIGQRYYRNGTAWTADELAQHLHVPGAALSIVMDACAQGGLMVQTNDHPPRLIPARPLETTPVTELLAAVRMAEETAHLRVSQLPGSGGIDKLVTRLDQALDTALHGMTLKDLALDKDPEHIREHSARAVQRP